MWENKPFVWSDAQVHCATPQFAYDWLHTEHPHAGLTGPWLIHGRCAPQCMGLVMWLALYFATVKKLAQKSKKPSSADAGLHVATAVSFGPLWQCMCKGTRFVLFPFWHELSLCNKVITNCTTGTPTLHAEASFNSAERGLRRGSRAEPLSNVTFILASFQCL